MNNYIVYKHTSPSGKVYIGITQQSPENRWQGGLGYRRNPHFFRAILKYGWDNFTHEILHAGLSKEEACAAEVALIAAYHSNEKTHGYNITNGGEMFKHSAESIQKMRENRKGKGHRTMPESTRQKLRENHGGGAEPKAVICLTTGRIYASINDAAKDTGVDKGPISRCCRGVKHYNTAGGLRWAYYKP
jgi:group I intron endonuclease